MIFSLLVVLLQAKWGLSSAASQVSVCESSCFLFIDTSHKSTENGWHTSSRFCSSENEFGSRMLVIIESRSRLFPLCHLNHRRRTWCRNSLAGRQDIWFANFGGASDAYQLYLMPMDDGVLQYIEILLKWIKTMNRNILHFLIVPLHPLQVGRTTMRDLIETWKRNLFKSWVRGCIPIIQWWSLISRSSVITKNME